MKIKGIKHGLMGNIDIPGDKSISHRSIILLSLSEGIGEIDNILYSEDVYRTIEIFRSMGIKIESYNNKLIVEGKGLYGLEKPKSELYCGNSGTTMRLLSGIMVGQNFDSILNGDASLIKRPMNRIIEPLKMMNGDIRGIDNNLPPLKVYKNNGLKGIEYSMKLASAQVKSAILLAGLYTDEEIIIREKKTTRNHTENMLNYLGMDIEIENNIIHMNGKRKLFSKNIVVPGDISSAAYFIVAGTIIENSYIELKDIGLNKTRNGIIEILNSMGGNIQISNMRIVNNEAIGDITIKYSKLNGIVIDSEKIGNIIDEIPIIAVAAAFAEGVTIIEDIDELRYKETDRLNAIITELRKSKVNIYEENNNLIIIGGDNYNGNIFNSYNDHRIAMAMSIFALKSNGISEIVNSDSVNISFPNFYEKINSFKNNII